jgi:hypothetical protein
MKLFGALMLIPTLAMAQYLTGNLVGLLHYSSDIKDKSVVLHLSQGRNGRLSGNLRGSGPAFWIPLDSIVIRDGRLTFTFASTSTSTVGGSSRFDPLSATDVKGTFRGILDPNGEVLHGVWAQTEPLPFRRLT